MDFSHQDLLVEVNSSYQHGKLVFKGLSVVTAFNLYLFVW